MIIWAGSWSGNDYEQAQLGLNAVGLRLAELTGLAPDEAFYRLFGDIVLEACARLPGRYHGYVMPGDAHSIKLRIGKVTTRLLQHELGHLANDNVPEHESPAYLLATQGIKTASGKWVTGFQGYAKRGYPWQQHPPGWKDYNDLERWADMFLAWATDNFTDDERGQALREFVENYLKGRLE